MNQKLKRLKYITIPNLLWKYTGRGLFDSLYSYYWLNIKKKEPYNTDYIHCELRWCRHCGKGRVLSIKK